MRDGPQLSSSRVVSLAVIVEGEAEAALLPFVARDDFAAVYVQPRAWHGTAAA